MATLFPRKRAILIGADKYESLKQLDFCGDDVKAIGEAFQRSLQFASQDILEFRLTGSLAPKRNQILGEMGSFLNKGIREDELLIFYFSGHGMIDPAEQKDYLLPVDASQHDLTGTSIEVEHIVRKLTATHCKNIVMFIDACREFVAGEKGVLSVGQHSRDSLERGGIVTFFSCDPKEKSYEIVDLKHGSFTQCVLDAISKGECTTVDSIDKYLRDNVPLINLQYKKPTQRPFTVIKPLEKGQLAIFFRDIELPVTPSKYDELFSRLSDLCNVGTLSEECFAVAFGFVEKISGRPALTELDKKRLRYVEGLCRSKFSCKAFEALWAASERSESIPPPKNL